MNLYDKYGGTPAVAKIMRNFSMRVFARPNLKRYYREDLDMEALVRHQIEYVSYLMGKPVREYAESYLKDKHANLGITNASFNEVAQILREELIEAGCELPDVEILMNKVWEIQKHIVTRN